MLNPDPQFMCDGCVTPKRETNHWFLAFTHPRGYLHGSAKPLPYLTICQWDDQAAKDDEAIHLCGENCAHKALDYFLQHKNLDGFKPSSIAS